jgi:hypothetical protein
VRETLSFAETCLGGDARFVRAMFQGILSWEAEHPEAAAREDIDDDVRCVFALCVLLGEGVCALLWFVCHVSCACVVLGLFSLGDGGRRGLLAVPTAPICSLFAHQKTENKNALGTKTKKRSTRSLRTCSTPRAS